MCRETCALGKVLSIAGVNSNGRCPSLLVSLRAIGLNNSMWEMPYICFLILVLGPSWYQPIWFGLLCAVFVFCVMWVVCRLRLRMIARVMRVYFDERLAERTRISRDLQDSMLQTVQSCKLITDDALDKSNDPVHMRLALEKLSGWLGQAMHEGQAALNSLRTATAETNDHKSNRSL